MDFTLRVGFPIVVILAMIRGYIVPGFIYDRVVRENDRLTKLSEEKVIPLAVEGQQLLRQALAVLEKLETLDSRQARQPSRNSERRDDDEPGRRSVER